MIDGTTYSDAHLEQTTLKFVCQVVFTPDGKSFLYAVASRGEGTIYRHAWSDGKLTGTPQIALKVPFAFPLSYGANAYDSRPRVTRALRLLSIP